MTRTANDVLQEALNELQHRRDSIEKERAELTRMLASLGAALAAIANEEADIRSALGKIGPKRVNV